MFDNVYLDTIISLVLIYALLSVIVSISMEAWNSLQKARGEFLRKIILRLLKDKVSSVSYGDKLYKHPVISALFVNKGRPPAYISSENFTHALIGTIADLHTPPGIPPLPTSPSQTHLAPAAQPLATQFQAGVAAMATGELKKLMQSFIDRNKSGALLDVERLKMDLARWFDDRMDRATGEYKLSQRWRLVIFGMLTAIVLNVDTFHLVRVLMLNESLRNELVAQAEHAADAYQTAKQAGDTTAERAVLRAFRVTGDSVLRHRVDSFLVRANIEDTVLRKQAKEIDAALALLEKWKVPFGWSDVTAPSVWCEKTPPEVTLHNVPPAERALAEYHKQRNDKKRIGNVFWWLGGVILSGVALSFGAPFWFEALVRIVNIRRTGVKPARVEPAAK